MIGLGEKILSRLSHDPEHVGSHTELNEWDLDNALETLCRVYPHFLDEIRGKRIVDFGCGLGYQSIAMIKKGAVKVLGLDTNPKSLEEARRLARTLRVEEAVEFRSKITDADLGQFDLIISQNSMEHFPDPSAILNLMKSLLNKNGKMMITFGPPWYAPYGSHMRFFTKVPWVNVLFPERTVLKVRARYRDDGAKRYEDVESGLNKMTIAKFERLVSECGMKLAYKKYDCIKKLNFLGEIPGLREFFINHVTCTLVKK